MARRKNPLITLLLLAVVVLAGLAGYTWYETGRLGLWPSYTETELTIKGWEKEIRENEKKMADLRNDLALGMAGVPRDEYEQRIADLEERNKYLRKLIQRYK
jgi:hypothetical protein